MALVGGEWLTSHPGCFAYGERAPGAYWIGGWVDSRASVDDVEKRKFLTLPGLELQPLSRVSELLLWTSQIWHCHFWWMIIINSENCSTSSGHKWDKLGKFQVVLGMVGESTSQAGMDTQGRQGPVQPTGKGRTWKWQQLQDSRNDGVIMKEQEPLKRVSIKGPF
jgi:hypothetical protein